MSSIITEITAKVGEEECKVDVEKLHEILLALPAEKYISLYHAMKNRIEGKVVYGDWAAENTITTLRCPHCGRKSSFGVERDANGESHIMYYGT